jgi:malate/lactate dehydrogenase
VEAILQVELTDDEQAALERSAADVLETMESVRS